MPRCIPTGRPASPTLHPFAQMPALLAVATVQEIIEAGATCGRCITSQAERSSSPDTPMMKGAFALPSTPSPNPMRIGCAPSYSSDGSRAGACLPLQPCPHRIYNASAVDCSAIEQLSPWRIVYPLVTLQSCQVRTPAFGFGWNARCTNSSCRCVDPMIDPPRKCSVNSCAITSRGMPEVLIRQRDKQVPNWQKK